MDTNHFFAVVIDQLSNIDSLSIWETSCFSYIPSFLCHSSSLENYVPNFSCSLPFFVKDGETFPPLVLQVILDISQHLQDKNPNTDTDSNTNIDA